MPTFRSSNTSKCLQLQEGKTAVSALQEMLQKRGASTPTYKEKGGGPPFTISCIVDDLITEATGNSKKVAKHTAAENMLIKLHDDINRAPGKWIESYIYIYSHGGTIAGVASK